ncbi:MAG: PDZ domain-containing protein [bacterium]|nr:PDZ domain-containing protein [bacterium]
MSRFRKPTHGAAIAVALLIASTAPAPTLALDPGGEHEKPAEAGEAFWEQVKEPAFMVPKNVPNTFADLAEKVSPAVVNIQVTVAEPGDLGIPRHWNEFHDFPFGFDRREPSWGEGSGFVISGSGYIVTNAHVVSGADEIHASFLDGRKLTAEVVGLDLKTDIALIKVESETPLQAIPLGDSDSVRPGEWVVAIGNAMSLEHSVTAGIVSAKHRYLARGNYDDFIQTDAAINPGNSGGPLINLAGEVIGINTAINPQANTIGFAVPIKIAKQILPQLKEHGRVTRSWLGVEIQELTEAHKQQSGSKRGALVNRVLPATPAMRGGLENGDVIVAFDGNPVPNHRQLPAIVANTPSDREVEVEVIRAGQRKSVTITLAIMDETEPAAQDRHRTREGIPPESTLGHYGLDAQDMDGDLAQQLGLDSDAGVIVTHVLAGSPADAAGLHRGDVILEVEGNPIASTGELRTRLGRAGEDAILLVRRDDATLFISLQSQ